MDFITLAKFGAIALFSTGVVMFLFDKLINYLEHHNDKEKEDDR
jgi:hypothetical protein